MADRWTPALKTFLASLGAGSALLIAWHFWPRKQTQSRSGLEGLSDDSDKNTKTDQLSEGKNRNPGNMAGVVRRPMYSAMVQKLTAALAPNKLSVVDESHLHRGHAGVRDAQGPETHFKVEVISARFADQTRIARQRLIYQLLDDEFKQGLHALQLVCRTPEEDAKVRAKSEESAPDKKSSGPKRNGRKDLPDWVEDIGDWIEEHQPLLIDVRSEAEVAVDPVKGVNSKNIPLGDLSGRLDEVLTAAGGHDRPVGLFCKAGVRSETAAQILSARGFTCLQNVHSATVLNLLYAQS